MRLFSCPHCGKRLYFENAQCLSCGSRVIYAPHEARFALVGEPGRYTCANLDECACNWSTEADGSFCAACRLNHTIPDLSVQGNRERWISLEAAKRRVLYTLLGYRLDIGPKADPTNEIGIAFDFLADPARGGGPGGERVLTGHDNGLITLNVKEADAAERERMRIEMGETYRTLLGHFRHELGHYYWDRLIRDDPERLQRVRALFGDDTADYGGSLAAYYQNGAPAEWQDGYISAYATMHPWEDWAETWAHYLHITDTLEMADAYHIPLEQIDAALGESLSADTGNEPDGRPPPPPPPSTSFDQVLQRWLVLAEAANQINRCMGLRDLYPFVISQKVAEKLAFVDQLLADQRAAPAEK